MNIAVVTGASSGIGKEFARQLDQYKLDEIWLIARREDRLLQLKDELDTPARVLALDLSRRQDIDIYSAALKETMPNIAWLVNASGFGKFGNFEEVADDHISDMIDVNSKALVLMTNASLPYMQEGGRIIEMCSSSSFTPLPNLNIYAATKAFVLHYSLALRSELKKRAISVTAASPCWVDTAFFDVAESDSTDHRPKSFTPISQPEDVVRKALKDAGKGKALSVYGLYAKLQHAAGKIFPKCFTIGAWMGMQKEKY